MVIESSRYGLSIVLYRVYNFNHNTIREETTYENS